VLPGSEGLAAVVAAFGPEVLAPDGTLDRPVVGRLVFSDTEKRKALNAIIHPRITQETMKRGAALAEKGEPLACYDAALIVENGVADAFRPLLVVSAPEELQVARILKRDKVTEAEALARVRAQMPLAAKVAAADLVIETTGTLEELYVKVDAALAWVCAKLEVDPARYPALPAVATKPR
jgi:dephospho-CoA kinase